MGNLATSPNARTRRRGTNLSSGTPSLMNALLAASAFGIWRMNDAASPFDDGTANNRDATTSGSVSFQHLAGPDGASYADFSGGFASIADANDFSIGAGMTWFIICKPDTVTAGSLLFLLNKWGNGVQYEWGMWLNTTSGSILATTNQLAGAEIRTGVTGSGVVSTSIWNVIAITIDSSPSPTSTWTMNVNGSWQSVTNSGVGVGYTNGTAAVLIGARGDSTGHRMDGHLAYAAILPKCSAGTVDGFMAAADAEGWF